MIHCCRQHPVHTTETNEVANIRGTKSGVFRYFKKVSNVSFPIAMLLCSAINSLKIVEFSKHHVYLIINFEKYFNPNSKTFKNVKFFSFILVII